MRCPRPLVALVVTMSAAAFSGCTGGPAPTPTNAPSATSTAALPADGGRGNVRIAARTAPGSQTLAEIYRQALERAGYNASVRSFATGRDVLAALADGDVHVAPASLGSVTELLAEQVEAPDRPPPSKHDLPATLAHAQEMAAAADLAVLAPSPAKEHSVFAVTKKFSDANGITTLSDLATYDGRLVLGATQECRTAPLCQPGLRETYGVVFDAYEPTDLGGPQSLRKLAAGTVTVVELLSSDVPLPDADLVVLEDDKQLQRVGNLVAVASEDRSDDEVLREVLGRIAAAMTPEDLRALHLAVRADRKLPAQAATDFLVREGLVTAR